MKRNNIKCVLIGGTLIAALVACARKSGETSSLTARVRAQITEIDKDRVLKQANRFLNEEPITVTASRCERSLGGPNDFYSEGDYWWPDLENPDGPYIRRDGMTNPDNFTDHRKAMRRMSIQAAALTAAFKITKKEKYASHAIKHLHAWFVNKTTLMNPNMEFAQAIKGRVPGRGVGLIDGIHLVEPARAISVLEGMNALSEDETKALKNWFAQFLAWMTTHEYGIDERDRENNHGTCWVMQAAEYARLTGHEKMLQYCRERYKTVLLPAQMGADGSFPLELNRTKPYGYSLFNMDIMAMVCHILSNPVDNLWHFKLADGRGMERGMEYIVPYIADKAKWPLKPDVMYWDEWPLRHPALLFAGMAFEKPDYIEIWKKLPPDPFTEEGWRNFPIRQPVLWID